MTAGWAGVLKVMYTKGAAQGSVAMGVRHGLKGSAVDQRAEIHTTADIRTKTSDVAAPWIKAFGQVSSTWNTARVFEGSVKLTDKTVVSAAAQSLCKLVAEAVRPLLGGDAGEVGGRTLADEVWALLHGMAALNMDRIVPFDLARVTNTVSALIEGVRIRRDEHPQEHLRIN
jgi:hypothetical protein